MSKRHPASAIKEVFDAGHDYFAENYVQELEGKVVELSHLPIRWSFIGRLQSNKIKKLVKVSDEIQTVASEKHARLIAQAAASENKSRFPIFISVNAGNEANKDGLPMSNIDSFAKFVTTELPQLSLQGLMAIPPASYNDEAFPGLVELYQDLRNLADNTGAGLLSLGMSNDMALAIRHGTDILRVGTAVFGPRQA